MIECATGEPFNYSVEFLKDNIKFRSAVLHTKLVEFFEQIPHLSVTADKWTSRACDSYLSFTGHFIDEKWKLQSVSLACSPWPGSHAANFFVEKVLALLKSYSLPVQKIHAIVTDNEPTNNSAGDSMPFPWVGCAAHLLNLLVMRFSVEITIHL